MDPKHILLFRHGIAIERGEPGCPREDAERHLTERGLERTRQAARGLVLASGAPGLILSSPYLRARQTADLLREACGEAEVEQLESAHLEPFGSIPQSLTLIAELECRIIAVVGHAPHLDLLLAGLLGRADPAWRLKKAGAAQVEWHPGGPGHLLALHPPRVLRHLAANA
ncbi:MAG: histidine phosphatase family protein [Deltaproteobacteria bacterium]|nr:histidine phosphatase family protein [Deltaproteobacteria bacterium]